MERVDCIVAGAGVVGLAIAREMARRGAETIVVDAEMAIGTGTSSRNSEVIHAGIYYEPSSLKASFCVDGRDRLYAYAANRAIPHRRCGKLVVATSDDQVPLLQAIVERGRSCGVHDLVILERHAVHEMEPELQCVAALWSPSTGIIDSHALMLNLLGEAEEAGAFLSLGTSIVSGHVAPDSIVLRTRGADGSEYELASSKFVNSAGLGAQALANAIEGFPRAHVPELHYARGNYFAANCKSPFTHLIYPLPEPGGLGVHLTLDLAGAMRFGPDVEWIDRVAYEVDEARAERFYGAIRKFWPALPEGSLHADYSGIRPKLAGPGQPSRDFLIEGEAAHGVKGVVNLFGIESPGLTSCLAIAGHVADLLGKPSA